ncbi:MAG: hypothetical protein KGQ83_08560, partial [Planctomycetes bacterium]|nr:hypothetical protein [Planctomycetota bacterium]
DQTLLNTKPLSRMEAARIVAQAVNKIKKDQYDNYNHRAYLEELLYQLVKEFAAELAEIGINTPPNRKAQSRFYGFKPIDHIQLGGAYANNPQKLVNNSGQSVNKGLNSVLTMDGRGHIGDILSLYYQPEVSHDKGSDRVQLQVGYGKLTFWNTEIEVGRDSLWWGPGFRGSMLFSNNAPPLDQIRIGSAEPFRLPWFLHYLGPIKITGLVGQLERDRDYPHTLVGAYRISMAPSRFIEVGLGRAFQFGGKGRGYSAKDLPYTLYQSFLQGGGADNYNTSSLAKNINNLGSLDVTVRIPNVDRYIFIARDMSIYGEMGVDDSGRFFSHENESIFFMRKPGGLIGTYLTGFLGDPKLDFRAEYASTSSIQFVHTAVYTSGFEYNGSNLSHFIGTDASEFYARLSRWINQDILLGFQVSIANIGPVQSNLQNSPHEMRNTFGPDISYRFSDRSSIFTEYNFSRVRNRNFTTAPPENDHLLMVEFTYSL